MIYKYHLECKKGCKIDFVVETDIKDYPKKLKPTCPECGRRIYQNDERTELIGPKKMVAKYKRGKKKTIEQEIAQRKAHKKANDGRRRKKKRVA